MSLMDMDTLSAAFAAHTAGATMFTRRMAINLADMDGTSPRHLVLRCERLGLLRRGSWDWIVAKGGITDAHIAKVRGQRSSSRANISEIPIPVPAEDAVGRDALSTEEAGHG